MALVDLANRGPAPTQLAIDSSLLLALRPSDDNPRAMIAHRFIGWLGQQVIDQQTAAWLLSSVLQESTLDGDWRRVAEFDIYTTPVAPLTLTSDF